MGRPIIETASRRHRVLLEAEIADRLILIAQRERRALASQANLVIQQWLERNESENESAA